jgi:hypothetical protein
VKKLVLAGILLLLAAPAHASDLLVALMDNGRGGKELHQAAWGSVKNIWGEMKPVDSCEQLIMRLIQFRKEDKKMQLTFTNPPFSGYALELNCIRPDGSIVSSDKHEPPKGERID